MKKVLILICVIFIFVLLYLIEKTNDLSKKLSLSKERTIISNNVEGFHTDLTKAFSNKGDELVYIETINNFGTGFIYEQNKDVVYIITASHILSDDKNIVVYLSNLGQYNATIVGQSKTDDLAVLKIEVPYKLKTVKIGSDRLLKTLEFVVAAGSYGSLDFNGSYSLGVVSSNYRQLKIQKNSIQIVQGFIHSDVKVDKGMSGGPLYNMAGEVVGINLLKENDKYCLSLGISEANILIKQIIEKGKVTKHNFNILFKPIEKLKNYEKTNLNLNLNNNKGLYIEEVLLSGNGKKLDFRKGDVILKFNNQETNNYDDFLTFEYGEYNDYKFEILRNGKIIDISGKLNVKDN